MWKRISISEIHRCPTCDSENNITVRKGVRCLSCHTEWMPVESIKEYRYVEYIE